LKIRTILNLTISKSNGLLVEATNIYKGTYSFRVSVFEPYNESSILERTQASPPCIEVNTYEKYEIKKILDSQ